MSDRGMRMDRNELVLVSPSKDMEHEILQYKEEHFAFGDRQVHGSGGLAFYDSFDEWLNRIRFIRENWKAADISPMVSGLPNAEKDTEHSSWSFAWNTQDS